MADDWIKMRTNLRTHPKVLHIAAKLDVTPHSVVGSLFYLWCLCDEHGEGEKDGRILGTEKAVDAQIAMPGLYKALISVEWLKADELNKDYFVLPRYLEHNGSTGKRRAEDNKRKSQVRTTKGDTEPVRNVSAECPESCGQDADEVRTREEKRREEEIRVEETKNKSSCADNGTPSTDKLHGAIEFPEFVKRFNAIDGPIKCKRTTKPRLSAYHARCSEEESGWELSLLEAIASSDHLTGQNERGWSPDIAWVLKPANLLKIQEGNYVNRSGKTNQRETPRGQVHGPDSEFGFRSDGNYTGVPRPDAGGEGEGGRQVDDDIKF